MRIILIVCIVAYFKVESYLEIFFIMVHYLSFLWTKGLWSYLGIVTHVVAVLNVNSDEYHDHISNIFPLDGV